MATNKVIKEFRDWAIFAGVLLTLYLTGLHTDVAAFAQRMVLATGVANPNVEVEMPRTKADYDFTLDRLDGAKLDVEELEGKVVFINFWATWCAPCLKELPYFQELATSQSVVIEVLLVSLDFADLLEERVIPLIEKKKITVSTVLLADENYNVWIDKIDPSWSGGLPATLFVTSSGKKVFYEQEFEREELFEIVQRFDTKSN